VIDPAGSLGVPRETEFEIFLDRAMSFKRFLLRFKSQQIRLIASLVEKL
jgi:hypothetical protein